jgi:hypothetical protein
MKIRTPIGATECNGMTIILSDKNNNEFKNQHDSIWKGRQLVVWVRLSLECLLAGGAEAHIELADGLLLPTRGYCDATPPRAAAIQTVLLADQWLKRRRPHMLYWCDLGSILNGLQVG